MHPNYTKFNGLRISLKYAIKTLGFSTRYQLANLHHVGNNVLRTLAIMVCLIVTNLAAIL